MIDEIQTLMMELEKSICREKRLREALIVARTWVRVGVSDNARNAKSAKDCRAMIDAALEGKEP